MKIVDAADAKPQTRKSPATKMLEEVGDEYLSVAQIAERYQVHPETIRRLIKATDKDGNPKLNAPSKAAHQGGLLIYLFTKEDVAELDEYMALRGKPVIHEK